MINSDIGWQGVRSVDADNSVQLKVELDFITPAIWRQVLVPDSYSLGDLHDVIQIAMGWHDCHLHAFGINGIYYTFAEQIPDLDMENENKVRLADLVEAGTKNFSYEYDFGDSWLHRITIEKISPADSNQTLPVCLSGARACPPEDCGSQPGYEDLADAVNAKEPDEDQEAQLEWLESMEPGWDPEVFSCQRVNQALQSPLQ